MASYEVKNPSIKFSAEFMRNKSNYLTAENSAENKLFLNFIFAGYYFNDNSKKLINEFLKWHQQVSKRDVMHNPANNEEYEEWENKILSSILSQLDKNAA